MHTLHKTFTILLALCVIAPADAGAISLFGLGKKKKKAKPENVKDLGPLPGLDGGSPDSSAPPRMAQEAASEQMPGMGSQQQYSQTETAVGDYPSTGGQLPDEVVIKGNERRGIVKPPLKIQVDAFESIRDSLKPDQQLLLAESPLTVVWRRTHPEFLRNERTIQPQLASFSERPGIVFKPLSRLQEVLQRKLERREGRGYQWSLTIADEEGKVFQHWEGSREPPEELTWGGQNDEGEWIQAGRAYSPVFMFTDPGGGSHTRVGNPLRFKGVVHQERDGLHISLDSAALFGTSKQGRSLDPTGAELLRSAADLIKRRYSAIPIRVEAFSNAKELAMHHAQLIESELTKELMLLPQDISTDSLQRPYSDQRVEIVLQNR